MARYGKRVKAGKGIPQIRAVREEAAVERRAERPRWEAKPPPMGAGILQGKKATSWEMMVARELERRRLRYEFQVATWGGRDAPGGKMLDFVVQSWPPAIIRVQGSFWHDGAWNHNKDQVEAMMLATLPGRPRVIDVYLEDVQSPALLRAKLNVLGWR